MNAPLSNSAVLKATILAEVGALGQAEGAGVNSRPELALKVVSWTTAGEIGEDDIASIWTEFQNQRSAAKGSNRDKAEKPSSNSFNAQCSKLRAFVHAASLTQVDFCDVITRAKSFIDKTPELSGSTFDNMLKVARTQKEKEFKDAALTDEQIEEVLRGKPAEEKTELDYLKPVKQALDKILNGTDERPAFPSKELEDALGAINRRVAVLELAKSEAETERRRAAVVAANPSPIVNRDVTQPGNENEQPKLDAAE
jgi:hypothetical protein